jgi:hypothetical protein
MSVFDKWYWFKHDLRDWWHDGLPMKIAALLPRKVTYWCALRLMAHATTGQYGNTDVTKLTAMETLDWWGHK